MPMFMYACIHVCMHVYKRWEPDSVSGRLHRMNATSLTFVREVTELAKPLIISQNSFGVSEAIDNLLGDHLKKIMS